MNVRAHSRVGIAAHHRMAFGLVLAAVLSVGALAGATPARADLIEITCTGTADNALSPGLLLIPQTVATQNTYTYDPCLSGAVPALTSGLTQFGGAGTLSCLQPLGSASNSQTIVWNDSSTTTYQYTSTFTTVAGQFQAVKTGTVTSGRFLGDTVVETVTGPALNLLDCLAPPGITSRSGVLTLVITDL